MFEYNTYIFTIGLIYKDYCSTLDAEMYRW